jgi:hypothetical protein
VVLGRQHKFQLLVKSKLTLARTNQRSVAVPEAIPASDGQKCLCRETLQRLLAPRVIPGTPDDASKATQARKPRGPSPRRPTTGKAETPITEKVSAPRRGPDTEPACRVEVMVMRDEESPARPVSEETSFSPAKVSDDCRRQKGMRRTPEKRVSEMTPRSRQSGIVDTVRSSRRLTPGDRNQGRWH